MVRLIDPETGTIVKEFAPVAARASRRRPATRRRPRSPPEAGGAGRDRDAAQGGRRSRRSRSSPTAIQLDQPVRLRPAARHRPARLGRDDRRDPDGRARSSRPTSPRSRDRAWSGPWPTARRRSRSRSPGKSVEVPVTVSGVNAPVHGRLRPRRQPGPLAARLQRRHLPRLGPGQERLQALAPRLRPDLRRPRPDRRPRGSRASTSPRPTTA